MDDLKMVAKAVGLEADAPVEKVLGAVDALQKAREKWEAEAHDNLSKLEKTDQLLRENTELKADAFIQKAVNEYRIEKAEAEVLKGIYLTGENGEKAVEKLLATRRSGDYFMRKSSLNAKPEPSDPLSELNGRAAEEIAKDVTLQKMDALTAKVEARKRVFAADADLQARYDAVYGARGGKA